MEWLIENWFWMVFGLTFVFMHFFDHRGLETPYRGRMFGSSTLGKLAIRGDMHEKFI